MKRLAAAALLAGLFAAAGPAAAADAAALQRGEQVYSRCIGCHAVEANRTGPQHCGLFGRRAGAAPGFAAMYSKAMRESKIVWDARTLDRFIEDPMKTLPGTAMGYAGVKDPKERGELIAWLQQSTQPGRSCTPAR
jgi:cytochrome c